MAAGPIIKFAFGKLVGFANSLADKIAASGIGETLASEGGYIGVGSESGNTFYHSADPNAVNSIFKEGFRTDIPTAQEAWQSSRYGRGVYCSDTQGTALAEGTPGGTVIEVEANLGRNLDISGRGILDKDMGQAIARGARKHGFDSITYQSAQLEGGINTVVFDPSRVVPLRILP